MNMNPMITMAQNSKTMQQKQNVQNGMSLAEIRLCQRLWLM